MAFKALATLLLAFFSTVQLTSAATGAVRCPGGQVTAHAACCVLFPIMKDLQSEDLMDGECGDAAHGALRIAFHDAIGFSLSGKGGGGADGSIVVFNKTELMFHANTGIDDILDTFGPNILAHPEISPGDYLQFANAVGLTNCPGAPRIPFLLGRPKPKAAAPGPDGLVPEPTDSVATLLARFKDAGFSPRELIALLASHSTAGADDVDSARAGSAFDSTPSTFDTQFYVETVLKGNFFVTSNTSVPGEVGSSVQGTLRLQSDKLLSQAPQTACDWQDFAIHPSKMTAEFGAAMFKLSLLGHNPNSLIDCSDVIPAAKPLKDTPFFPPTLTHKDVQQACVTAAFPNLSTAPGPAESVPPIEQADDS